MEICQILSKVDHTLLSPAATWTEICALCDDAVKYGTASVCIPASYVKRAKEYTKGTLKICTVIGFPTGYSTTEIKVRETERAILDGADEIDMVINVGWLKDRLDDDVLAEIKAIRAACENAILKVIVEACLLTEDEKIRVCRIVSQSGADYIKTSTGFSIHGATPEDVALFAKHIAPHVKIKAAGGIRTIEDAENYIRLGADRLGTSALIAIAKKTERE